MRLRTAQVQIRRADGVAEIFEHAVERRLAWIFGTGHVYKDLINLSNRAGYRFWVPSVEGDDPVKTWLAVREDLILEDSWADDTNLVTFDTTREGFGTVVLSVAGVPDLTIEDELLFYLEDDSFLSAADQKLRVHENLNHAAIDSPNYEYLEYTYSVMPSR